MYVDRYFLDRPYTWCTSMCLLNGFFEECSAFEDPFACLVVAWSNNSISSTLNVCLCSLKQNNQCQTVTSVIGLLSALERLPKWRQKLTKLMTQVRDPLTNEGITAKVFTQNSKQWTMLGFNLFHWSSHKEPIFRDSWLEGGNFGCTKACERCTSKRPV